VEQMLLSFPPQDRGDMVQDGKITVTCEFCSASYVFDPAELSAQEALVSGNLN
jgi:molecular chaperone Hsp33